MEVIVGKSAGFCPGVQSAVERTEKLLNEKETMFCIGELAHNRQVMENLENKGLVVKEKVADVLDNVEIIFRAHGVPKEEYSLAKEKNLKVNDFTCVKVLALHDKVKEINANGKFIFLYGERNHPEIIGTKSLADDNNIFVLEDLDDIDEAIDILIKSKKKELYILAQTTYSFKRFDEITNKIKEKLKNKNIDIEINKSICRATELRQSETDEISKKVDFMIIIGGKNSANTKKLFEISEKNCKRVIHIETKDNLENVDFEDVKSIGVMAGASTPKKSIEDIVNFVSNK